MICREGDEIVGFLAYYENAELLQLYVPLVCVTSRYQRMGLGGKMFNLLEEQKARGFTTIGLEVVKTNEKGYNFYVKHGFTISEDRGRKYLMVKRL